MKLLEQLNTIIQEAASRTLQVDGYEVVLEDYDATHGYYPGQQLFAASHHGPAEWSDDETHHLTIDSLVFVVSKGDKRWSVVYNLDGKDYHEDEKRLVEDLKASAVEVLDDEDDQVTDQRIVVELKRVVAAYCTKFDCLGYLYQNASQKELQADNGREDDGDYDEVDYNYDGN
jgi:hypothetical protein